MTGDQNASPGPASPFKGTDTEKAVDTVLTKEAHPILERSGTDIDFTQASKKSKKSKSEKKGGKKRKRTEAVPEEQVQPIQPVEDKAAEKVRRSSRIGDGIQKPSRFRL